MKRSIIAAIVVAALGFFSMGFLGLLLYYPVYPLLAPFYGNINYWMGDDVWPAIIAAGVFWSLSFLVAGAVYRRQERAGVARGWRRFCYVLVLWLGAALVWFLLASTMEYIRFPT